MPQPSASRARVLQLVTIVFDIDLEAGQVDQVHTDFTAPLRVEGLMDPGQDRRPLTAGEEKLALDLTRNSDLWPEWTMIDCVTPHGETLRPSSGSD